MIETKDSILSWFIVINTDRDQAQFKIEFILSEEKGFPE